MRMRIDYKNSCREKAEPPTMAIRVRTLLTSMRIEKKICFRLNKHIEKQFVHVSFSIQWLVTVVLCECVDFCICNGNGSWRYTTTTIHIHIYTFIYLFFCFFLSLPTLTLLYVSIKCAVHAYNSGLKLTHKYSIHYSWANEMREPLLIYYYAMSNCIVSSGGISECASSFDNDVCVSVSPLYDAGVRRLSAFISMQYFQNAIK